jgi:uncharacterized protein involved in exopolysaccharide biosynthesis
VTDAPDMREQYEHALAEVMEMKRALAEHSRHVAALERQLMRQVEEGARGTARETGRARREPAGPEPTQSDLARAVAEAEAEKALATAERERLDERERNIRRVERELASLRVELERQWRRATGSAPTPSQPSEPGPETKPPSPTPLPTPPSEPDLEPAATAPRRTTRRK